MLVLTDNQLSQQGYMSERVPDYIPKISDVDLFDQNGYDLTVLEQYFVESNNIIFKRHRPHRQAIKYDWFTSPKLIEGAHVNHALLFERKGFCERAKDQLLNWCTSIPLFYKVLKIRPKWGIDISIDYCDGEGNVFEVLHFEYDGFDYNEINDRKQKYEQLFLTIDWDDAAKKLLARKDQWHDLDFFSQSEYKCKFFGIENEKFKMVLWE